MLALTSGISQPTHKRFLLKVVRKSRAGSEGLVQSLWFFVLLLLTISLCLFGSLLFSLNHHLSSHVERVEYWSGFFCFICLSGCILVQYYGTVEVFCVFLNERRCAEASGFFFSFLFLSLIYQICHIFFPAHRGDGNLDLPWFKVLELADSALGVRELLARCGESLDYVLIPV